MDLARIDGRLPAVVIDVNAHYFPHDEGSIYIVVVKDGHEYQIAANDNIAMDDGVNANPWERDAYKTHSTASSPVPVVGRPRLPHVRC